MGVVRENINKELQYSVKGTNLGNNHFGFTGRTKEILFNDEKITLNEIFAKKEFKVFDIQKNEVLIVLEGQVGGWVEHLSNIMDNSWITIDVEVHGINTTVMNSIITGKSKIGDAYIYNSFADEIWMVGSVVDTSIINKAMIKMSDITDVKINDSTVFESMIVQSTLFHSFVRKSNLTYPYVRASRVENSNIKSISTISISSVNYFDADYKFKLHLSHINGRTSYYRFSRVGMYEGDMIFHLNKNTEKWQVSYDGNCLELVDFERWVIENEMFSRQSKAIRRLIDYVDLLVGFNQKRLTKWDKVKIWYNSIVERIKYIHV